MWVGVAKEEKQSYGKRLEDTKLKPVFLNICDTEDLESLFNKKKIRDIKKELVARL